MVRATALINHSDSSSTSEVVLNFPPHRSAGSAQAVPVGSTNRSQRGSLVPVYATNRYQRSLFPALWDAEKHLWYRFVPPTGTNATLSYRLVRRTGTNEQGIYTPALEP